jgi:hypothetical protein
MKIYRVARWEEIYENNRSRTVKDLRWVSVPNNHDGEKYTELMERDDAAVLFTAWILIVEVASRCWPRGVLVRADGSPYDAHSLARKTRGRRDWFEKALPYFESNGWLLAEEGPSEAPREVAKPDCHHADSTLTPSHQPPDEGGEGNGGDRIGGEVEGSAPSPGELPGLDAGDASADAVMIFPTVGRIHSWALKRAFLEKLEAAYPGLDVMGECRKALGKFETGAVPKKTAGGMSRFLWNWMDRSQNDRRGPGGQKPQRTTKYAGAF